MRKMRSYIGRHHVSLVALFFALSGTTAVAATQALPKNSVGTRQVVDNSLQARDVKKTELATLRGPRGLPGIQGSPGVQGPHGLTGPKGDKGDAGEKGDSGDKGDTGETGNVAPATVQFEQATADLPDGVKASYNAFCPAGQQAVGGGFTGDATDSDATNVGSSRPALSPLDTEPPLDGQAFTGWRVTVHNPTGGVTTGIRPEVWVVCVPAPAAP